MAAKQFAIPTGTELQESKSVGNSGKKKLKRISIKLFHYGHADEKVKYNK